MGKVWIQDSFKAEPTMFADELLQEWGSGRVAEGIRN